MRGREATFTARVREGSGRHHEMLAVTQCELSVVSALGTTYGPQLHSIAGCPALYCERNAEVICMSLDTNDPCWE